MRCQSGYVHDLPTPSRERYYFMGWFTEPNGGGEHLYNDSFLTADTTVYAHWDEIPFPTSGTNLKSGDLALAKLSPEEIVTALNNAPTSMPENIFSIEPSYEAPYSAGQLAPDALQVGLDRLNALRRLAGVPSVALAENLNRTTQHGAVLLAINGRASQQPSRPEGADDEFYHTGSIACQFCSVIGGYSSLARVVDRLMESSNSGRNADTVGNRRWQLNPFMGKVGFGYASHNGSYVVEWVLDQSGEGCDHDFVSWPASGYFPTSLFRGSTPWSISLNPEKYTSALSSDILLTLKQESDGRTWTFDSHEQVSSSNSAKSLNLSEGYGTGSCIIFHPDGIARYEGLYTVTVTGLQNVMGEPVDFGFQVEFFDPDNITVPPTAAEIAAAASDWARPEVKLALDASLVPDALQSGFTDPISRQDFCALMVRLVERSSGQDVASYLSGKGLTVTDPFSDTDDPTVLSAYALGIVKGTSATTFTPTGSITRQDAATMLTRTGRLLGIEAGPGQSFSDADQFGAWAVEGIAYVSGLSDAVSGYQVMGGTGEGRFSPLATYSREQAILTALRLFRAK